MRIDDNQKCELEELYAYFLNNPKIQKMKEVSMHRGSNTYLHSFKVAKLAVKRGSRHKNVDLKAILIASILHDYYLYDWRVQKEMKKDHGKVHPYIAAKNAEIDFKIDEKISKIIKTHMWPINIKEFPDSKEARIVNFADDHVALFEALSWRKFKKRKEEKYYKKIAKLF